jgi:uncharacterized protein with FMN-binding domain
VRTRALLGSIFASTALLVIGWQAGSVALAPSARQSPTTAATTTTTTSPSTSSAAPTAVAAGPADGTYTGESVRTRFGSVQVAVTIASGSITDVAAVHLTDADGRSVQISNRAAPILRDEVIASQSAKVSNVSGATYTTDAYLTSVQSALDQAGL